MGFDMTYLLDTCILSYYFRKEENVIKHIKSHRPSDIKISVITLMEIEYGLCLNNAIEQKIRPLWEKLQQQIEVLSFNDQDAKRAAIVRGELKQLGMPIGAYDILLAGMALNRGLIFVTANTQEFLRVKNLLVENWQHDFQS